MENPDRQKHKVRSPMFMPSPLLSLLNRIMYINGRVDLSMHKRQAYSLCRQYINHHVKLTTKDGQMYEGFVENVDQDHVYLAVPRNPNYREMEDSNSGGERQFGVGFGYPGFYGYGYPPYGYGGYEYGYPSYDIGPGLYPRRRFRRLAIPLAFLGGIALSRLFY